MFPLEQNNSRRHKNRFYTLSEMQVLENGYVKGAIA